MSTRASLAKPMQLKRCRKEVATLLNVAPRTGFCKGTMSRTHRSAQQWGPDLSSGKRGPHTFFLAISGFGCFFQICRIFGAEGAQECHSVFRLRTPCRWDILCPTPCTATPFRKDRRRKCAFSRDCPRSSGRLRQAFGRTGPKFGRTRPNCAVENRYPHRSIVDGEIWPKPANTDGFGPSVGRRCPNFGQQS